MPIYEYRCGDCGHELEALQKLNDEPLLDCPECSASRLRRLMSAPNFRLKGSGWYETDFKSDADAKRNLADKGEAQDAGSGKDDQSKSDTVDTKPAAKTAAADSSNSKSKPAADAASPKAATKPKPKPSASDSAS